MVRALFSEDVCLIKVSHDIRVVEAQGQTPVYVPCVYVSFRRADPNRSWTGPPREFRDDCNGTDQPAGETKSFDLLHPSLQTFHLVKFAADHHGEIYDQGNPKQICPSPRTGKRP